MITPTLMGVIASGYRRNRTPEPTFSNVSLLIHGDQRPFIDVSLNQFPVENHLGQISVSSGAVNITTATGTLALRVPGNAAFKFGTGAFCVAAYVFAADAARVFDTRPTASGSQGFFLGVQASSHYPFLTVNGVAYGVGGAGLPAANIAVPFSSRTHVAFTYDGTTLRCFVGGALSWSHTVALNLTTGDNLCIGNDNFLAGDNTACKLDELLIVKGEAVYTAAFTPPTRYSDTGIVIAQADAPTFANVKLLIHGSSLTNGSTAIVDNSTAARTVSVFGNCAASTAQFRIGTSSIAFDGTGDYMTVPQSADFAFGTGEYCFELEARQATTGSLRCIAATYADSTHGWALQTNATTAGDVNWNTVGDGADLPSSPMAAAPLNTWAHLAVCRYVSAALGSLEMLFAEGELINFVTNTESISATLALYIGRLTNVLTTRDFNGFMQEIRAVKGEPVYKRSFLVPTGALPNS